MDDYNVLVMLQTRHLSSSVMLLIYLRAIYEPGNDSFTEEKARIATPDSPCISQCRADAVGDTATASTSACFNDLK